MQSALGNSPNGTDVYGNIRLGLSWRVLVYASCPSIITGTQKYPSLRSNESVMFEVRIEVTRDVGRNRMGAPGGSSRGNILLLAGCRFSRDCHWARVTCALFGMCVMLQPNVFFFFFLVFELRNTLMLCPSLPQLLYSSPK